MAALVLAAAASATAAPAVHPGTLDRRFGDRGLARPDVGGIESGAEGLVVQPDGWLVAVGYRLASEPDAGIRSRPVVVRLDATGTPDPGFGRAGVVTLDLDVTPHAVAGLPGGGFLLAGEAVVPTTDGGSRLALAVVQLRRDGSLDGRFGERGVATAPIGASDAAVRGVAVAPDGGIVVAGSALIEEPPLGLRHAITLLRLDRDGRLDGRFGRDGVVITARPGTASAEGVAVQGDGRILVAGREDPDALVCRYDAGGRPDPRFGSDGCVRIAPEGGAEAASVLPRPDGGIVVGGCAPSCGGDPFGDALLVRLDAAGTPDPAFGTGGMVRTRFEGRTGALGTLVLDGEGRLVAAGFLGSDTPRLAVARWEADGRLDERFANGMVSGLPGHLLSLARAVAVQADGRLVVAGAIAERDGARRLVVLRLEGDAATPEAPARPAGDAPSAPPPRRRPDRR